jgi:hypothetical protein
MNYTTETLDTAQIMRGEANSGFIIIDEGKAYAFPAPFTGLSRITKGLSPKVKTVTDDSEMLVQAAYISHLRRTGAPHTQLVIEGTTDGLDERTRGMWAEVAMEQHFYEKIVEQILRGAFIKYGSVGVGAVNEVIKRVEDKSRWLDDEELDFIKCVESVANEAHRVPLQKEVRVLWEYLHPDGNKNTFNGIKKRLGFSWLPAGTRGKRAEGRGFTSGK